MIRKCGILLVAVVLTQTPGLSQDTERANRKLEVIFERLDKLGWHRLEGAKFVELTFASKEGGTEREKAWLLSEDDEQISILKGDLLPRTYNKKGWTTVPSSWRPMMLQLRSVKEGDLEQYCRERLGQKRRQAPGIYDRLGPPYYLLVACAAWKNGMHQYCVAIVKHESKYSEPTEMYWKRVCTDLAWLHYLRAVNLLMFTDRREVLPHLKLVMELSPESDFGEDPKDLIMYMERLIEDKEKTASASADESKLSDAERARFYVSQLKDLHCEQLSQPGEIMYYTDELDFESPRMPTTRLRNMGMTAVPALIDALEDATPTRTVYHHRDFTRHRAVWRVRDFAWHLLRDITKRNMGYEPSVGFTFSYMQPDKMQYVIKEINEWYEANKDMTQDERMLGYFGSAKFDDWITAGEYFAKNKDKRAVKPLLEKLRTADSFQRGDLCELVAEFGDPTAIEPIRNVMHTAREHSDRLSGAIGLWKLGDKSGLDLAIGYAKDPDYGQWVDPIWFLMYTRDKRAIAALESLAKDASPEKLVDLLAFLGESTTGDLRSEAKEPAGCAEICPLLISLMDSKDYTGQIAQGHRLRIKDLAAKVFALMRSGSKGHSFRIHPRTFFNDYEPSEAKRDAQIEAMKKWYLDNKDNLYWDSKRNMLAVKD